MSSRLPLQGVGVDDALKFCVDIMKGFLGGQKVQLVDQRLHLLLQLIYLPLQTHCHLVCHSASQKTHEGSVNALVTTELGLQVTIHALK